MSLGNKKIDTVCTILSFKVVIDKVQKYKNNLKIEWGFSNWESKKEVLKMIKVENITNKNGRKIPNQFIIETNKKIYFQSYNSIIVKKEKGKIYLDVNYWDYSLTTGKYRNLFLGEDKKTTERKIKEGVYILTNLNGK